VMTAKTDLDHYQQHQALTRSNPHAAALYLNENADAVSRGRMLDKPAKDPAPALIAKQAERKATVLSVQRTMQADAAALLAFNDYEALKARNPHAAALRLNEDSDAIFRGRELAAAATPDPEPPQAA
jgi:hypothetical protein